MRESIDDGSRFSYSCCQRPGIYRKCDCGVLENQGYKHVAGWPGKPSELLDRSCVDAFFAQSKPEYVFLAAGKSAGIMGNIKYPAELMPDNLLIVCHIVEEKGQEGFVILGTGKPRREFMYFDDLADACIFVMNNYSDLEPVNLSPGGDLSIAELAYMVKATVGFKGELVFDAARPDGMPLKLLNTSKLKAMGRESTITFQKALDSTYAWFLAQKNNFTHNGHV